MAEQVAPLTTGSGKPYVVACFCAAWCHTCAEYYDGFYALEAHFPDAEFRWLDIEDDAEAVGDREVENFPTILVQRAHEVIFYGPQLPMPQLLRRLLETLIR
jgi:thiol-disulfide isomerase/thioredoxin